MPQDHQRVPKTVSLIHLTVPSGVPPPDGTVGAQNSSPKMNLEGSKGRPWGFGELVPPSRASAYIVLYHRHVFAYMFDPLRLLVCSISVPAALCQAQRKHPRGIVGHVCFACKRLHAMFTSFCHYADSIFPLLCHYHNVFNSYFAVIFALFVIIC